MKDYFLMTDRVGFYKWSETDINLASSLWGNAQVTKYICATGIFTDADIENRLKKEVESDNIYGVQYWPIFNLENDEFIGCCGLHVYNLDKRIYEIGFHLRPDYWGKGLAKEAARALIEYAFQTLKVNNLFAGHNPNNNNSKKVLEEIGFHYIGDEFYEPTGLYHPSYMFK